MEYQEFKKILKNNNLTIKKFSELSEISYATCNNWSNKGSVSSWVGSWLNLYTDNQHLKNDKIDDEEYQELLQIRRNLQLLLSKGIEVSE